MTQNNVQFSREPCSVRRTAVVGGKRRLRLRFVFPLFSSQKRVPRLAFRLFGVCVCTLWLLSCLMATSRLPDLGKSLRYMCSVQQYETETLETAADVQLSIVRLLNLTKRKFSWGLKTHLGPCNIVPTHASKSLWSFRNTCARLRSTVLGALSDLRSFSPVKWHCYKRRCRAEQMFVGMRLFFHKSKRKPRKKCLVRCSRLHRLEKLLRGALAVAESPKVATIL